MYNSMDLLNIHIPKMCDNITFSIQKICTLYTYVHNTGYFKIAQHILEIGQDHAPCIH